MRVLPPPAASWANANAAVWRGFCSRGIQKAFAEIPYVLPHLFFPNKLFLSFDTVKTTLRDSVIVACTIVAMVFAARLWDLLVATLLNYGMSALVGRPPL